MSLAYFRATVIANLQIPLGKSVKAAKVREATRKARKLHAQVNQTALVGKLSSCTGRKPEENELFIVEGIVQAVGKQGRDRRFRHIAAG